MPLPHDRAGSFAGSIEDLRDVNELDIKAEAFGAALLMHQARHVRRYDIFCAGTQMIVDLVVPHLRGHRLLKHRKGAAEAATFVRPLRSDELDSLDLSKQVERLREKRL